MKCIEANMIGEFHIHTVSSDGVLTVEEVLSYLQGKVQYCCITDHDTLSSSIHAHKIAKDYNLTSIVGVEMTTYLNDESIHILGYFREDRNLDALEVTLSKMRAKRLKRLYEIKEKLLSCFDIDLDITDLIKVSSVTRGNIGREIVKQGYNYTMEELFSKVIGHNCPAYVPVAKITPELAIKLIHEVGGLAVLAHPTLLKKNDYKDVLEVGCDGIEAIYPLNKAGQEKEYRLTASKMGLFITGGSDFHSFGDPSHGDLASSVIYGADLEKFLDALNYRIEE